MARIFADDDVHEAMRFAGMRLNLKSIGDLFGKGIRFLHHFLFAPIRAIRGCHVAN
jgi:hypothetical protein